MLEQTDLNKAGDLMKEIVRGQKQFFNNGQGKTIGRAREQNNF